MKMNKRNLSRIAVYALIACLAVFTIGLTVSAKLGHAVVRNRTRRRIREIYRLNEACFTPGWDIVIVARTRSVEGDFSKMTAALLSLAQKCGLTGDAT